MLNDDVKWIKLSNNKRWTINKFFAWNMQKLYLFRCWHSCCKKANYYTVLHTNEQTKSTWKLFFSPQLRFFSINIVGILLSCSFLSHPNLNRKKRSKIHTYIQYFTQTFFKWKKKLITTFLDFRYVHPRCAIRGNYNICSAYMLALLLCTLNIHTIHIRLDLYGNRQLLLIVLGYFYVRPAQCCLLIHQKPYLMEYLQSLDDQNPIQILALYFINTSNDFGAHKVLEQNKQ